jgi:hypothetical protein
MTISFKHPSHQFWAEATSHELYMLDLHKLFTHLFCAKEATTIEFLQWLPTCYFASPELCTEASHKLAMLQAPLTYCNEDCDRRQAVSAWAMNSVPAGRWMDFRNHVAYDRLKTENKTAPAAV